MGVLTQPLRTTFMLCLERGAEMRLAQVLEDTTMFVSGYEHHTWQCSACSTVERRMTFSRDKTPTRMMPAETNPTVQPTQTVPTEPAPTLQPTQTVPIELTPKQVTVEPTETLPTQAVPAEPANPTQPVVPQMDTRLEKLRKLQERATVAKEAASETERREEFKRFWESLG
jgi:hypothetical protein